MSVQRKLEQCKYILLKITESKQCLAETGYDTVAIKSFVEGIDAALNHYKHEAQRAKIRDRRLYG